MEIYKDKFSIKEAPLKIYARGVVSYIFYFSRVPRERASAARTWAVPTHGTSDRPMSNCSMPRRELLN